ncbi:MAG: hypothetical protein H8D45_22095 [Bacteroidetes bacterium]|nr:hypothetical protein [Bacteroidota bacterium]
MIIVFSIIASGFMIKRYSFYDEYLVACVVIGALLSDVFSRGHRGKIDKLHVFVFSLFIVYLIIQSIRGSLVLYSPRKIRWIVFFILLLIINNLSRSSKYPKLDVRKLSYIITVTSLIYFGFYFVYGFLFELLDISRYALQFAQTQSSIAIWGTTAYATFPVVITMPAAFVLIKDKNSMYRRLGWVVILLLIIIALYYNSRIATLAVTVFFIFSVSTLGVKKWLKFALFSIFFFVIVFILTSEGRTIAFLINDVFGFGSRIVRASQTYTYAQDVDRYVWTMVAFESISDNWMNFLFGHGFRTSGYVVAPHVYDWFQAFGKNISYYSTNVGTEMFTNLVVETGTVGLGLFTLNFIILGRRIFSRKYNPQRYVLLAALALTYFWIFVINIIDVVLLYLLIMPNGLIAQLGQYNQRNQSRKPEIRRCTSNSF